MTVRKSCKEKAGEIADKLEKLELTENREAKTLVDTVVGKLRGVQNGIIKQGDRDISDCLINAASAMRHTPQQPDAVFKTMTTAIKNIAERGIGVTGYDLSTQKHPTQESATKEAATSTAAILKSIKVANNIEISNHYSLARIADIRGRLKAVADGIIEKGDPRMITLLNEAYRQLNPQTVNDRPKNGLELLSEAIKAIGQAGIGSENHYFDSARSRIRGGGVEPHHQR